jgi:prepilin-type N-terminal cleavage/methylation domain-containing protein
MKKRTCKGSDGYTLIELMVVIAIIGTLASIATPNYLRSRMRAQDAACQANRLNIETVENTYFITHNKPSLSIRDTYACPSGGVYVWMVSDPDNPDYPTVGCSIHFIAVQESSPPADADIPDAPDVAMQDLIAFVKTLGLSKKVETDLLKGVQKFTKLYDAGEYKKAGKTLDKFKKKIKKNRKSINSTDEAHLYSTADEIQELLRQM